MQSSSKIKAVIFSKDRASQLLLLLDTYHSNCLDIDQIQTAVIYKCSGEKHTKQYASVQTLHPEIQFIEEDTLEKDTKRFWSDADYIFFMVDDCVFVKPFEVLRIVSLLQKKEACLGFSLRLGQNTTYCYPFSKNQCVPIFEHVEDDIMQYNWTRSELDFGYPLEVSSSIFRMADLRSILSSISFSTVNELESILASHTKLFSMEKQNLLCFELSRAFCNPLNVVSCPETNKNRRSELPENSSEYLTSQFEKGYKIDPSCFIDFVPNACHQEVSLNWIQR